MLQWTSYSNSGSDLFLELLCCIIFWKPQITSVVLFIRDSIFLKHMKWSFNWVFVNSVLCNTYLVVLVGCHSDEGSLREDVSAESRVFWAEAVILVCLDNVETRLVFVHGIEYYLQGGEIEKVRLTDLSCFHETHRQMLGLGLDWRPGGG